MDLVVFNMKFCVVASVSTSAKASKTVTYKTDYIYFFSTKNYSFFLQINNDFFQIKTTWHRNNMTKEAAAFLLKSF